MTGALLCTVEYDVATVDHKAASSHHRQVTGWLATTTHSHPHPHTL